MDTVYWSLKLEPGYSVLIYVYVEWIRELQCIDTDIDTSGEIDSDVTNVYLYYDYAMVYKNGY